MLAGAVSGDVFASPNVKAILAAILAVAGDAGVLLVVKNYTGDRLAFGAAAGMARSRGINVETVYVADDIAVDGGAVTGRRGLAGTVLVHKVAGALANAGADLRTVARAAALVADASATIGVALSTCSVPGVPRSDRLSGKFVMELGLGIHGEPGAVQMEALPRCDDIFSNVWKRLVAHVKADSRRAATDLPIPAVVMVNNLGGTSQLEMGVVLSSLRRALRSNTAVQVHRLIVGSLMTSLDMHGVSVTVLPLDASTHLEHAFPTPHGWLNVLDALSLPTPTCPFPPVIDGHELYRGPTLAPLPDASTGAMLWDGAIVDNTFLAAELRSAPMPFADWIRVIIAAADALDGACDMLNSLDTAAGDGDCGTTMRTVANAVRSGVAALLRARTLDGITVPVTGMACIVKAIADSVADAAGGTSGIVYAMLLHELSARLASADVEGVLGAVATSAAAAVHATVAVTRATAGSRTMMDALLPAVEALERFSATSTDALGAAEAAAYAAEVGAEQTQTMQPRAGRSSFVSVERLHGVPDPGARAAAVWIRAVANALTRA